MIDVLAWIIYAGVAIHDRGIKNSYDEYASKEAIERGDDYYIDHNGNYRACDDNTELFFYSAQQILTDKRFYHYIDPYKRFAMENISVAIADGCRYANIGFGRKGIFFYDLSKIDDEHPYGELLSSEKNTMFPIYKYGKRSYQGDFVSNLPLLKSGIIKGNIYPPIDFENTPLNLKEPLPSNMTRWNFDRAFRDIKSCNFTRPFANIYIHEYERYITVMFNEDGKCKFIGNSKPNATYSSYICGVKKQFGVLGTDGEDASVFYKGRCI